MHLTRRLLLGSPLLASPALHAQSYPKLAIASAVGDRWTLVQRGDQAGTHLDPNHQESFPAEEIGLDALSAGVAAEIAVQAGLPAAQLLPFKLSSDQRAAGFDSFATDPVSVPEPLGAPLRAERCSHLLLVLPDLAQISVEMSGGTSVGRGPLRGLGFYVDPSLRVRRGPSGSTALGLVAACAHLRLSLVDLEARRLIGNQRLARSSTVSLGRGFNSRDAWSATSPLLRQRALQQLLVNSLRHAVPGLLEPLLKLATPPA